MTDLDLSGLRILVVEDEPLLALDLELELAAAGATVVGSATTVRAACDLARREALAAAVLDVRLGHEEVEPVALALQERGIPFVFHTGHGAGAVVTANWPEAPVVHKPAHPAEIIAALAKIARRARVDATSLACG